MTDNEIIYFFKEGCSLLNNDDVDGDDMANIRDALEKCAKSMCEVVHKYTDERTCRRCAYQHTKKCKWNYCENTREKRFFKEK